MKARTTRALDSDSARFSVTAVIEFNTARMTGADTRE
jgi:hypothetical protein